MLGTPRGGGLSSDHTSHGTVELNLLSTILSTGAQSEGRVVIPDVEGEGIQIKSPERVLEIANPQDGTGNDRRCETRSKSDDDGPGQGETPTVELRTSTSVAIPVTTQQKQNY